MTDPEQVGHSIAAEGAGGRRPPHPLVKLALELGPLGVFFFANARWGIFEATGAFMAATVLALAASFAIQRTVPLMPLVTGVVVLVFGGLTLWLDNELFIKLKPTIVNALFAVVLFAGLAFGKSLLGYVFESVIRMDAEGWRTLTWRWALFFVFLAVVNEVVWRSFSTDFWVSFKVFAIMPITFVFALAQLPLMQRHALDEPGEGPGDA